MHGAGQFIPAFRHLKSICISFCFKVMIGSGLDPFMSAISFTNLTMVPS